MCSQPILTGKVPPSYTYYWQIEKWYLFHIPNLELCTPFNCYKCTGFEICKKSQNQNFFWTFSQTEMTHFPTLSYTSISKRECLPFHLPKAEIGSPFRVKPFRIGHFWGYPPGMCSGVKDSQWWKTTVNCYRPIKLRQTGKWYGNKAFLLVRT